MLFIFLTFISDRIELIRRGTCAERERRVRRVAMKIWIEQRSFHNFVIRDFQLLSMERLSSVAEKVHLEDTASDVDDQIHVAFQVGKSMLFRLLKKDTTPLVGTSDEKLRLSLAPTRRSGLLDLMEGNIDICFDDPSFRAQLDEGPAKRQLFQRRTQLKKREEIIRIAGAHLNSLCCSDELVDLPALSSAPTHSLPKALLSPDSLMTYINQCIDVVDANLDQALQTIICSLCDIVMNIDNSLRIFEIKLDTNALVLQENANKRQIFSMIGTLESKRLGVELTISFLRACAEQLSQITMIALPPSPPVR